MSASAESERRADPPPEVVTIGETMACLASPSPPIAAGGVVQVTVAGAESNTAVGLSRQGRRVAWISRLGADPFGTAVLDALEAEGLDLRGVSRTADAPTGLMCKHRLGPDDIEVFYWRTGSAVTTLRPEDLPVELLAEARWAHLTGITLVLGGSLPAAAERFVEQCAERGLPISFDPNLRTRLCPVSDAVAAWQRVLPRVTHLLLNDAEARALGGDDPLRTARELVTDTRTVVLKRGADGAIGISAHEEVEIAAVPVRVVDTVGAGDAFNAGFVAGQLDGLDLGDSLHLGARLAAGAVSHLGDFEGVPTRAELTR